MIVVFPFILTILEGIILYLVKPYICLVLNISCLQTKLVAVVMEDFIRFLQAAVV